MEAKKMLVTAIMCAVVSLGIGGTSSAATPADNSLVTTIESTVETQNLALLTRSRDYRHVNAGRGGSYRPTVVRGGGYRQPTPPQQHYPTPHHRPHYRR